jgi:predicted DNA-binding WGR domain protein
MGRSAKLVFQEGSSNKFWNATVEENVFTVHYGRIGTEGQTVEKKLGTPQEAEKAFDKKLAEKLKEGYRQGEAEAAPVPGQGTNRPYIHNNFAGFKIKKYTPKTKLAELQSTAYKFQLDYEEGEGGAKLTDQLSEYVADPSSGETGALIIGAWEEAASGTDSSSIVEFLVSSAPKLPKLRALFIGDMEAEESEISWINQSDMSPIFLAYPNLQHFMVRGGTALSLGTIKHKALKSLVIESGGLPSGVVSDVGGSDLPELEYLELWLGTDNYGGDSTAEDVKELLSGKRFPKLKYLGLRDAEIADDLAKAVAKSPLLERIEVLDLSMGALGDEGAEALLKAPATKKLKKLDLHWHYMSKEMLSRLRDLGIRLDVSEQQEQDDPDDPGSRYVQVSE